MGPVASGDATGVPFWFGGRFRWRRCSFGGPFPVASGRGIRGCGSGEVVRSGCDPAGTVRGWRYPAQPVHRAAPRRERTAARRRRAGRRGRGRHHPAARHAQGRLLGQRPRRPRLPHPPAGPGDAPARRHVVDRDRAVRPARRLVGAPAPGGRRDRRPHRHPARRPVDRRHPHPRRVRAVPRHRLLQPARVEPSRLRPGVHRLPGRPDRRCRHRGARHPRAGEGRRRQHRGVGPHPQPLARPARPEPDGDRQAPRPAAQVGVGQPAAAPGARRPHRRGPPSAAAPNRWPPR